MVTEPPGDARGGAGADRFERIGVRAAADARPPPRPPTPRCCSPTPRERPPIVGVGLRGTLEEFLDGSRDGLGSGYVTRLKVGPRLVDATAVPMLYSGQLRARHAYLVLLIGLIAVAAAIATTDVGHQWVARPA